MRNYITILKMLNKRALILIGLAVFLFIFLPGISQAETNNDWLHTDGRLIKDASGNVVNLRGVHMYVCLQNEQAKFIQAAAMGANVIRLALWKNAIEGNPSGPCVGMDGLVEIDKAVQYAKNAGLKVILDEHFWSLNVEDAPLEFFTDPALQASWLNMWQTLINRYKNDPTVVGIDLMNEPWAIVGRTIANKPQWEAIAENAVAVLHPLNPNLIIFVEGWGPQTQPMWSDIPFLQQPNVAISDHVYGQKTFQYLSDRYEIYTSQEIPVWLGEIGFTSSEESFMISQLNSFDSLGLHYTLFVYGVASWNLSYDIVDSSYNLTSIGLIYSNHLNSMSPPADTIPPVAPTGLTVN